MGIEKEEKEEEGEKNRVSKAIMSSTEFFDFIRNNHTSFSHQFKRYAKCVLNLTKATAQRVFLLKCRKYGIFPANIINNTRFYDSLSGSSHHCTHEIEKQRRIARSSLLNLEIRICQARVTGMMKELNSIKFVLRNSFPDIHLLNHFIEQQCVFSSNLRRSENTRLERKFDHLLHEQFTKMFFDESCFKNLTDIEFPLEVKAFLSLGPKFSVPIVRDNFPLINIIAETEYAVQRETISEEQRVDIRSRLVNIISNHINRMKKKKGDPLDNIAFHLYQTTKRFMRDHSSDNFIVTSSDKGNVTVAMPASEYTRLMSTLVDDTTTYKRIEKDPTSKLQKRNNELVKRLFDLKFIDSYQKSRLTVNNAVPPRLYGLPKIHKSPLAIRPIISTVGSVAYGVSRVLAQILQNMVNVNFNVYNSFTFQEFVDGLHIPPGHVLTSFDVISLFTNVSVEKACAIIQKNWSKIERFTTFPLQIFLELVRFCMIECNYFLYNGIFYQQIFGTAMGSPLSAVLAILLLDDLIETKSILFPCEPVFFVKYVDDFLTLIPMELIDEFLNILNGYDDRIKFTHEVERDSVLNFLDLSLIRTANDTIVTRWYQKPISSGRMLNYNSYHSLQQKNNLAYGFINRVFKLSNEIYHLDNVNNVYSALTRNSYPANFIEQHLTKYNIKSMGNMPSITVENTDARYVSLTYVRELSEKIKKIFRQFLPDTKVAFRYHTTARQVYSSMKDKLEKGSKPNVIYEIPCNDCREVYIGQTGRHLGVRLKEHKSDTSQNSTTRGRSRLRTVTRRAVSPSSSVSPHKTALKGHAISNKHSFNFDECRILDVEQNLKKRLLKEACYITINNNSCNNRSDCDNISHMYSGMLHSFYSHTRTNRQNSNMATADISIEYDISNDSDIFSLVV